MYAKCPSCGAELSFLPPSNIESLPNGYKHRMRCPHCGVTFGVSIKKAAEQQGVTASSTLENTYNKKSGGRKDDGLQHEGSLLRSAAVVLKGVIITLFVCACILVAIGIAAFVLYMLSESDIVALSLSMEEFADWYWVYGAVGIVAGLLLFWFNSMISVQKKRDDDEDEAQTVYYKSDSSSTTSKSDTSTPKSSSSTPTNIYLRPPNFLDKAASVFDHWVGRPSYEDTYNKYKDSRRCGKCRWYEAGDAQGYAPGYCRYHSRTALWGDDVCDDYE